MSIDHAIGSDANLSDDLLNKNFDLCNGVDECREFDFSDFEDSQVKKRKLSIDSLTDSLEDEIQKTFPSAPASLNTTTQTTTALLNTKLPVVESFLFETGLNVQLIDKNDKKLIKLNILNQKPKIQQLVQKTPSTRPTSHTHFQLTNNYIEFDDLPSESDISSGPTMVLSNNNLINLKTIQNKTVTICFKCNKCSQMFNSESILKEHQLNNCADFNTGNNLVEMMDASENNCVFGFDDKSNESSLLSENLDDLSASSTSSPIKVRESLSSKKRLFICNECGRQFFSQNELSKHMLHTHESQKPFECAQCQMQFNDLSSKKRHEKEHSGYKPFRCYICSFEFTRASNLRAHLLKVHPGDIGKSVVIAKTADNKLKFEFNLDEINNRKEQNRQMKLNARSTSLQSSLNASKNALNPSTINNTVIYIKDPNNKNADIQHMIVYVDGKPIFVQNPKIENNQGQSTNTENDNLISRGNKKGNKELGKNLKNKSNTTNAAPSRPVAKIPYLLAAAAAAAASNHRQQQQQMQKYQQQNSRLIETTTRPHLNNHPHNSLSNNLINPATSSATKDLKHDQEYLQLVSMFKQKNEKLFNPLLNNKNLSSF